MSESETGRRREGLGRPPIMIVLPLLLVIVIAVAWSAIWYFGVQRAEERLDAWLAQEAARGRTYECPEREVGGYPFRVELRCAGPSADIADAEPRIRLAAEALRAVAMVWRLEHVIVELDGPMRVEAVNGQGEPVTALTHDWSLWQGSFRVPEGRIRRFDVAVSDMSLAPDPATGGPPVSITAEDFELHARLEAEDRAQLAMDATQLVVAIDGAEAPEPVDVAVSGELTALPEPLPRQPADFFAAWRANEGALLLQDARATQGDTVLHAAGRLVPDESGRPEGTITVSLAGPDVTTPGAAGAFGGIAPVLATALRLAGRPSELDGNTAVSGDLELEGGTIRFGPLPLGRIPELF